MTKKDKDIKTKTFCKEQFKQWKYLKTFKVIIDTMNNKNAQKK